MTDVILKDEIHRDIDQLQSEYQYINSMAVIQMIISILFRILDLIDVSDD